MLVLTVWFLCGAGLYASGRMLGRSLALRAGRLREPSVVERPAAQLFGVPNAALGLGYYPLVAGAYPWAHGAFAVGLVAIATFALATSVVLAADLVLARAACRNCWLAHACNGALWIVLVRSLPVFP